MRKPRRQRAHLERAFVFHRPDADADRDDGHEDERDEDEDPQQVVLPVLQLVAGEHLEEEEEDVHRGADQHRLVVQARLAFRPAATPRC